MKLNRATWIMAAALAATSCGGGDSGTGGPIGTAPTPTPAPVPTPTPSPTAVDYTPNALPSAANALVGLHDAPFTSYAWSYGNGGFALNASDASVQVGYDPVRTSTTIALPGFATGYLDVLSNAEDFSLSLLVPTGGMEFTVLRPGVANPFLALQWTSAGSWVPSNKIAIHPFEPTGVFAYGLATPASGVPTTGTAVFTLWGPAVENNITEGIYTLRHGGEITFDFAARTVSGRFARRDSPGIPAGMPGEFTLEAGTLAADGTFAGTLSREGLKGTYAGRLSGPQAQEVLLRWSDPNAPSGSNRLPIFGVLVGKKP